MKLSAFERIVLSQALPALIPETGNRHLYAICDKLAADVSLTEKETKHIGLKTGGQKFKSPETGKEEVVPEGNMAWRPDRQASKNVDIPKILYDIIVKGFREMDERDNLPKGMVPVFDRFVKEAEWHKDEE